MTTASPPAGTPGCEPAGSRTSAAERRGVARREQSARPATSRRRRVGQRRPRAPGTRWPGRRRRRRCGRAPRSTAATYCSGSSSERHASRGRAATTAGGRRPGASTTREPRAAPAGRRRARRRPTSPLESSAAGSAVTSTQIGGETPPKCAQAEVTRTMMPLAARGAARFGVSCADGLWFRPAAGARPTGCSRGRSAVGSASPCQGEGRGFESRRPLGRPASRQRSASVEWPRGEATACKAVYTGSIPVSTSAISGSDPARLAQRESASLTRKRSLVQSQYRPPIRGPRAPAGAFVRPGPRFASPLGPSTAVPPPVYTCPRRGWRPMYGTVMIGTLARAHRAGGGGGRGLGGRQGRPHPGLRRPVGAARRRRRAPALPAIRFADARATRRSSDDPEQDAWWASTMAPLFAGEVRWIDGHLART